MQRFAAELSRISLSGDAVHVGSLHLRRDAISARVDRDATICHRPSSDIPGPGFFYALLDILKASEQELSQRLYAHG